MIAAAAFAATLLGYAAAQDPAGGWLGYAQALPPSGKPGQRLTFMQARWRNNASPRQSSSFYSPWFGVDTADNLNLLQPVNPWLGSEWQVYCEYYQWSPSHNQNSASHVVQPGDELYGSITYDAQKNLYNVYHNSSDGWEVNMPIKIQKDSAGAFKNYSIAYVVWEKVAPCGDYPPDEVTTFYDMQIEWDYQKGLKPVWSTSYVEDVCEFRAHVVNPSSTAGIVNITWNTKAADPPRHLIEASQAVRKLGGQRQAGKA